MADKLRPLVAAPLGPIAPSGPFAFAESWAGDFRQAGQSLHQAASAGHLTRGIRHVLTHLVIFHWNRFGLSATTQAILSRAAREALLPTGN
jgi:thiopeptide-type bacteriocin biosynthesis protein